MRTFCRMFLSVPFACVLTLGIAGCGGNKGTPTQDAKTETPYSDTSTMKSLFQEMAQSGDFQRLEYIEGSLSELRAKDPAKADMVAAEVQRLKKSANPNDAKKLAAEIAEKL